MKEGARLVWNVGANYARFALLTLISLLLNPFMFHRLGSEAYGVIALTGSTTGLLQLLDAGLAHAVARFVSRAAALDQKDEVNRVVTTAIAVYAALGLLSWGIVVVVGLFFLEALGVPESVRPAATWVFILTGLSLAIRFPGNALEGALRGLQRFELANAAMLVDRVVFASLVAVALTWLGAGLVTVGACLAVASIVAQVFRVAGTYSAYRSLRVAPAWFSGTTARQLFGFGTFASLTQVSSFVEQTVFKFIISAALSSTLLGAYHLVTVITGGLSQLVIGVTSVIMPMASRYHAVDDQVRLRRLLLDGSKLVLALILPVVIWIIVMARPILLVWVGPELAEWSPLLRWMTIVVAADQLCGSGSMVLMGMGRVRAMGTAYAASSLIAAVLLALLLNLSDLGLCSAVLALGAAVVTRRSVILVQMCRGVHVSVWHYIRTVVAPALASALISGTVILIAHRYWLGEGWSAVIVTALLAGVVHVAAAWWIVLDGSQRRLVQSWFMDRAASQTEW